MNFSKSIYFFFIALIIMPVLLIAQQAATPVFEEAIEDNSFFIEEAYNQETGVVQHILNVMRSTDGSETMVTFTEEVPILSQTYQLSVTLPFLIRPGFGSSGMSDIALNYRYQLFGPDEPFVIAPRLSFVLGTGNVEPELGTGKSGIQLQLPISHRLSNEFITHLNVGATLLIGNHLISKPRSARTTTTNFFVGGSIILLAHPKFNVHLEAMAQSIEHVDFNGHRSRRSEWTIAPAMRYAIDIGSTQIVPGLCIPFISTDATGLQTKVFLYLSVEHPM